MRTTAVVASEEVSTLRTQCKTVWLEAYTSVLGIDRKRLEGFYGREIMLADRNVVESEADRIYAPAKEHDVALLVVGDPFCATTHTDFLIRARQAGIRVQVIHNASAMGAAGACGLQLYSFGYTVSIPFFDASWRPDSFYDRIKYNKGGGMHTLCLLDIKVKEPDFDAMIKGKKAGWLPPRFMSINTAVAQLLEVEEKRGDGVCTAQSLAVGMARLGQPDQTIVSGTLTELLNVDFGRPLHCLALVGGELHDLEKEMMDMFGKNHTTATISADEVWTPLELATDLELERS